MATEYQKHKERWSKCRLCALSKTRRRVVIARGDIPCRVLFLGEAPGVSEDLLGTPFVGPAGKLLDQIIEEAGLGEVKKAFANVLGCIPLLQDQPNEVRKKTTTINPKYIKACALRVKQFVKIARPDHIVCVGSLPDRYAQETVEEYVDSLRYTWHRIIHPSAILRMESSQGSLSYQRAVVILQDVAEDILHPVRNVGGVPF